MVHDSKHDVWINLEAVQAIIFAHLFAIDVALQVRQPVEPAQWEQKCVIVLRFSS
jgi:thymidylate kinase